MPAEMEIQPRILGVDPGLKATGYAVIEPADQSVRICEAGIVRGEGDELAQRIAVIHHGLIEIIDQYEPQVMVVEQLYAHYAHPRTAILMGHARGVILLAAAQKRIQTVSYNATRIKKTITGSGRATKDQVQRTIQQELNLDTLPEPADVADALAVALCHHHAIKL